MVSFFSCGPNRGLAWARMAMSQLQRDPTCCQPQQHGGRHQDPGMLQPQGAGRGTAAPGGEVFARGAGRSPGAVPFIHGQEAGQQPPGPVKPDGGWGRVSGPGPQYSQEVAAHGGGDQHRDDHPAETPALGQEAQSRTPPPPAPASLRGPHSPAVRPLGHEPRGGDAHEAPEGGEEDERQREAVRRHGRSAPTDGAAAAPDAALPTAARDGQSAGAMRRAAATAASHWRRREAGRTAGWR